MQISYMRIAGASMTSPSGGGITTVAGGRAEPAARYRLLSAKRRMKNEGKAYGCRFLATGRKPKN
jgi:hypothetical protein